MSEVVTAGGIVGAARDRLVAELGLVEDEPRELMGQMDPVDGQRVGELRIYRGDGISAAVYAGLTVPAFGMDTHQLYAFTPPDSPIPHFTVDVAISPNTDDTFHVGLDLQPRIDLGADLAHLETVYEPLSELFGAARDETGWEPATSIGPLARALRSPWMIAAYVQDSALAAFAPYADAYLDHWLSVVSSGVPATDVSDLAARDRRNREAVFSIETNRVWGLLDKLLGTEQAEHLRKTLIES